MKLLESATAKGALVGAAISGIVAIIIVCLTIWLPAHLEGPQLKEKNAELEKQITGKNHQINELQTQLVPFKTVAFQNFTGTEAERLAQLALRLNDVQKGLETLSSDQTAIKAKTEQINVYASEAKQKTQELETIVTKAADAQKQLGQVADFTMLLTRATNDDRVAFDQLVLMAQELGNPNSALAQSAIIKIATDKTSALSLVNDLTKRGLDPDTASIAAYREFVRKTPRPDFAASALAKLMTQERFRKRDRIQMLIDTIHDTKSVAVLHAACTELNSEAKLDKNIIGWMEYIRWWEVAKERYLGR